MEKFFADAPPLKISALKALQIYPWEFVRYVHTADMLALSDKPLQSAVFTCIITTSAFGHAVLVINIFQSKNQQYTFGLFLMAKYLVHPYSI